MQQTMFNQREIATLKKHLNAYANDHDIPLNALHTKLKTRNAKSVCKTFHRVGLVVPFDRKTEVGYRPLIETDGSYFPSTIIDLFGSYRGHFQNIRLFTANLKKILQKFPDAKGDKDLIAAALDNLEPLITAANIGTFSFSIRRN